MGEESALLNKQLRDSNPEKNNNLYLSGKWPVIPCELTANLFFKES